MREPGTRKFFITLIFCLLPVGGWSLLKDSTTLKVEVNCGASINNEAIISVISDFKIIPKIHCADDHMYSLTSTDDVYYSINTSYSGDSSTRCVFQNKREIYSANVVIGRLGRKGVWVRTQGDFYSVTCTFEDVDQEITQNKTIDDSKAPMNVVMENHGGSIASNIALVVEDVTGAIIKEVIPVGKTIRLHGRIVDSKNNETGMRPMNCKASNSKTSYPLLLAGCGDGLLFTKKTGFTTRGLEVFSPFFTAFRLEGGVEMLFHCDFTACYGQGGCNGTSCEP